LKSTETQSANQRDSTGYADFSNFGSLKSTETSPGMYFSNVSIVFQQFRLVEEH